MSCCCCPETQGARRLFSFLAKRHRKKYARRGFEASQKQLLAGITDAGIEGASLLEIGSGVGHLHQTLIERGARQAVGVDLAPKMLVEARASAVEREIEEQTSYVEADFVAVADSLESADITVLDKVVCCYPDADGLIHKSLDKTDRILALTYPRDRWYTHVFVAVNGLLMWLIRSDYRSYVHPPTTISKWIEEAGFRRRQRDTTWFWLTEIYERV
ncbi:MAG: methyltransferase domain-containing protein [Myxococcales bacterium]|nr:methyltransferase domain-containing protein [Myxococcales bacterium]